MDVPTDCCCADPPPGSGYPFVRGRSPAARANSIPGILPMPSAGPGTSLEAFPGLLHKAIELSICCWVPRGMFLCFPFNSTFLLPGLFSNAWHSSAEVPRR